MVPLKFKFLTSGNPSVILNVEERNIYLVTSSPGR